MIEAAEDGRTIAEFREKPADPVGLPDAPDHVFASMGNYVFTTEALIEALNADAVDEASNHDLGGDLIPALVASGDAQVYDFSRNECPGPGARPQLLARRGDARRVLRGAHGPVSVDPVFNLYNPDWPILTWHEPLPPAKFVLRTRTRTGHAVDSMVCPGVVVSGGVVRRSVLSPGVRIHSDSEVEGSILMHGVDVGRGAVLRNAIVDKNVRIAENARVGVDLDRDRERFVVSENGVVVIGKNAIVEA